VVLALPQAREAAAENDNESAVEKYEAAIQAADAAWDAGDFEVARSAFLRAYAIHPEPVLQFNVASTYRREGNLVAAKAHYEVYLKEASKDDPRRRLAEETLSNIRKEIALREKERELALRAQAPPIPAPAETEVPPETAVVAPPVDFSAGGPSDSAPFFNGKQWIGMGVGTLGLVSLSYGILQGSRAVKRSNELEALAPGDAWTPEQQARFNEGESFEKRAIVFSLVGAAAVATGATLFYFGYRQKRDERRTLVVLPVAGVDMAGAAVVGSF